MKCFDAILAIKVVALFLTGFYAGALYQAWRSQRLATPATKEGKP